MTVVRNAIGSLRQTLDSVLSQDYENIEYVVIDGGSTDGSERLLREYEDRLDALVIEPDNGIAQAMNKAISIARGDYLVFIHADDRFASRTSLSDAIRAIDAAPCAVIYACCIDLETVQGTRRICPRRWLWLLNLKQALPHQGALCRRELFSELGGFDETYRIAMDYELFLRAYRAGRRIERLTVLLSVMGREGISSRLDREGLQLRLREEHRAHEKHAGNAMFRAFYALYWVLYPKYKSLSVYGSPSAMQIGSSVRRDDA